MARSILLDLVASCIFIICVYASRRKPNKAARTLPPGPARSRLVGNLIDVPVKEEWATYTAWAKYFGEVIYLKVFSTPIVILSSHRAVKELLEKRSNQYSERPPTPPMMRLAGFSSSFPTMGYTSKYRSLRKLFDRNFRSSVVDIYRPIQRRRTDTLLKKLHESPEKFIEHIKYALGAIVVEMVYGYEITSEHDEWLHVGEQTSSNFHICVKPGAWAVDALPLLQYAPTWLPGTKWKMFAKKSAEHQQKQVYGAFNLAKSVAVKSSMVSRLLEGDVNGAVIDEDDIAHTASVAYGAAVETVLSSILTFILQISKSRSVQLKAQEELDRICPDRLPTFDDKASLPYIEAIAMEVIRWHPGSPQGIPHYTAGEDVFEGMHIPKGSIVIANIWGMCHDETDYDHPLVFNPGRFVDEKTGGLRTDVKDPRSMAFGFGHRKCPGRFFAESQLFYTIATILKLFDILPPLDKEGNEVLPHERYQSGVISIPEPFACRILPRSEATAELIKILE